MQIDSLLPVMQKVHPNLNKGHHFEFKLPPHQQQFAVLVARALEQQAAPPGRDWRGHKFGRLTVVAFSHANSGTQYWVVRCVCGNYEMRRRRTLRKASPNAMCLECSAVDRMHYLG